YVFDKDFQLPQTWNFALSWENEFKPNWALLLKANYSKTDHITRWFNNNAPLLGCPWNSGLEPAGVNGINCSPSEGVQ
ncbi:MAG: hypothetical protein GTO61_12830, partial [Gemmatimonadales bacterium]|nr:hypothetical protein [Gemmatimonadales bacterium]